MAASSTVEAIHEPGNPFRGRYFPNDCPTRGSFDSLTSRYPIHSRYLPTEECLTVVRDRFGERAAPLLSTWKHLWKHAVGDVEAFAKHVGIEGRGPECAEEAPEYPGWPGPNFFRPASFHVLEDAIRHVTAVETGVPFVIKVGAKGLSKHFVRRPGLRLLQIADWDQEPTRPFAGTDRMSPYWSLKCFAERAGRGMAVADTDEGLVDILLDMRAQGHRQAFLKGTESKSGTWVVDLPDGGAEAVRGGLLAAMGDRWENFAAGKWTMPYLVQAMVPFVREHRFYVVSHRVAASTASDRALSVLDAPGSRILDERVARLGYPASEAGFYDRGEAIHEVDRPLVARMALGARDLARGIKDSGLKMDCYVIDMGQTDDGRVLPIEINGLSHAGLYGASVPRILKAFARRARAMGEDPIRGRAGPRGRIRQFIDARTVERSAFAAVRRVLAMPDIPDELLKGFERHNAWDAEERQRRKIPEGRTFPEGGATSGSLGKGGPWRRRWAAFLSKAAVSAFASQVEVLSKAAADGRIEISKHVYQYADRSLRDDLTLPGWGAEWQLSDVVRRYSDGRAGWVVSLSVGPDDIDPYPDMVAAIHDTEKGSLLDSISDYSVQLALRGGARPVVTGIRGDRKTDLPDPGMAVGDVIEIEASCCQVLPQRRLQVEAEQASRMIGEAMERNQVLSWRSFLSGHDGVALQLMREAGTDADAWEGLRLALRARHEQWASDLRYRVMRTVMKGMCLLREDAQGRILLWRIMDDGQARLSDLMESGAVGMMVVDRDDVDDVRTFEARLDEALSSRKVDEDDFESFAASVILKEGRSGRMCPDGSGIPDDV